MRLKNKVGIVTAAASGMGRAGVLKFAREGAAIAVVDLDDDRARATTEEIERLGGKAMSLSGDLTDESFAREIVRSTNAHFGRLDFIWAHAGHPGPAAIEELNFADFDLAINLNLRTALTTVAEAIPIFKAQGGGSVLFTASTSGVVGSPFSPVYSAAKFGIVGLSRSLARRYGRDSIRFNVISPGSINTPMLRVFVARPDQVSTKDADPEALATQRGASNPMGRMGLPEEIANAALFLLSDEASFITGANLPVDGGYTS